MAVKQAKPQTEEQQARARAREINAHLARLKAVYWDPPRNRGLSQSRYRLFRARTQHGKLQVLPLASSNVWLEASPNDGFEFCK